MDMREMENFPGRWIDLEPAQPLSFRIAKGDAVVSSRGVTWLTQEGMLDDVILESGKRFVANSDANVLVSAMNDSARVRIIAAEKAAARPKVTPDVVRRVEAHARALRRAEWTRVMGAIRRGAQALGQKARDTLRGLRHEHSRNSVHGRGCAGAGCGHAGSLS